MIKALLGATDLEGCSPLQPGERNIVPLDFGGAEGSGALQGWIKTSQARIDFGGLQSLAAVEAALGLVSPEDTLFDKRDLWRTTRGREKCGLTAAGGHCCPISAG